MLRDHGIRLDKDPPEVKFEAEALGYDNLLFPAIVVCGGGFVAVALGLLELALEPLGGTCRKRKSPWLEDLTQKYEEARIVVAQTAFRFPW